MVIPDVQLPIDIAPHLTRKPTKLRPLRLLPRTGIDRMFQVAFRGIGKLSVKNFPTTSIAVCLENSGDRPKKKMVCVVGTS